MSLYVPFNGLFNAGVPFTTMMCVKEDAKGVAFPAITRSLVDLDGPLFKVFCRVSAAATRKNLQLCKRP